MSREVVVDLLPRIQAAADAYRDASEAARLLAQQRDELIVTAVDAGVPYREIARAAGVVVSRVTTIVGNIGSVHYL